MATLGKNPQSKRSLRRAKRNFQGSRPNRRGERRHQSDLAGYNAAIRLSKSSGKEYTKPGSINHW